MPRVNAALATPICGGELVYGIVPFRHMIEARSVDYVMIDLIRVGGITQWMKVAGKAFGENDVAGAVRAARAALGTGPRERLGTVSGREDLAPYFVLAAIVPLGVVLRRRNF